MRFVAKPSVGVLSRLDLDSADRTVREVLRSAEWTADTSTRPELFRDRDGLPYFVEIRPWPLYGPELEPDDEATIAIIGERPTVDIELSASVSDPRCHRTLGVLALSLAEASAGWIDLGGALGLWGLECDDVAPVHRYLDGLGLGPGLHALEYETARGTTWISVLMDPNTMRTWLDHPDFHLVT